MTIFNVLLLSTGYEGLYSIIHLIVLYNASGGGGVGALFIMFCCQMTVMMLSRPPRTQPFFGAC